MADGKQVILKIKRQAAPKEAGRWEEFALPWRPAMNIIICLRDIAENPVTRDGKKTTPVSYDSNCLEEVCGSCAMLINGKARMACSALVDQLEQPIRIEPMSKFPVVRDLAVDRQFMFESLKRVKAWIPIDGSYNLGEGPRVAPETQEKAYPLSRCITCGNCLEVCPQVNGHHQPGAAFQYAPHGCDACQGTAACRDGGRRHRGLRQCAELRQGLPQGNSADRITCRNQPPGVETGTAGVAGRVESSSFSRGENSCRASG
jgi:succinate dehydrogenase/fumarate reductase iron-sulfur protein